MPPAPLGCAYLNFTASHDGIGMRPAEGLLSAEQQAQVIDTVREIGGLVSMRALPGGGEAPYEINTTFFDAMQRTFEGPDDYHFDRFMCSQTLVMALEGIPAFYIHSLLATPNDRDGVEKRGMNRAINRHRWDYPELRALLEDPETMQARVMEAFHTRLALRKQQAAFHPNATQFTLNSGDTRVFTLWRQSLDRSQSIFALHNVSKDVIDLPSYHLNLIEDETWVDILTGEHVSMADGVIRLAPYQCRWITNLG